MNLKSFRLGEAGFSIIEALVALAIFTIGILAVATMQIAAINTNSAAGASTRAIEIASDRIERLSMIDYDDAALLAANNPHTAAGVDGFSIEWNINENVDVDGDGVNDAKRIDVDVSWQTRKISLTCIRAKDYYK